MVWVAVACALVVLILLIAFILQNQKYVQVKFVGLEGSVPLGIALFIAAVGGGVLVAIAGAARIINSGRGSPCAYQPTGQPGNTRTLTPAGAGLQSMNAETTRPTAVTTAAADWTDVERLFGVRGESSRCWCRFFALTGPEWSASTPEQRKIQFRDKFDGGAPAPGVLEFPRREPRGLVRGGTPGCSPRILRSKVLAAAGPEVARDHGNQVWSVTCFVVSPGHRRTGVGAGAAGGRRRARLRPRRRSGGGYPSIARKGPKPARPTSITGPWASLCRQGSMWQAKRCPDAPLSGWRRPDRARKRPPISCGHRLLRGTDCCGDKTYEANRSRAL